MTGFPGKIPDQPLFFFENSQNREMILYKSSRISE